ncbi:MAG TPA: prepilin-type N-terminal cleavage/methylation domain-containing protein [Mizugakiibacter sp.]
MPRGFSLLELVAALALFAVASAVLYGTLAASLHGGERAAEVSTATLWGESLLDTLGADEPLRSGVREGRFDRRYQWRLTVAPWQAPQAAASPLPSPVALYRVELEVSWRGAAGPQQLRFSTLRALTAPATGAGVGGGP